MSSRERGARVADNYRIDHKTRFAHRPAASVGAQAVGAIALAVVAVGAFAVGALAIGALAIGRARVRRLEIDELVVRRLRITEKLHVPSNRESDN